MDKALRQKLLATTTAVDFLAVLHGGDSRLTVLQKLHPHGGPGTRQSISYYASTGRLTPQMQRAYALAYGFLSDHRLRTHLQDLVAAGSANQQLNTRQPEAVSR